MKKFQLVHSEMKQRIATQALREGDRLPTEAQIMAQYGVSRPTVARAFRLLEEEGLVVKSPGVGSFVRGNPAASTRELLFGLAFPEFGHGEIFDPITSAIAQLAKAGNFSLLWGTTKARDEVFSDEELLDLIDEYVSRKVDGVFFAPLEGDAGARDASALGLERLAKAQIPVVLIDRDLRLFPERSDYPLVCLDNIKAGFVVTEHFLSQGERRVDFVWLPYESYTVDLRMRGYRMALQGRGLAPRDEWVHTGDPEDPAFARSIVESGAANLVCGNDETAALLMNSLRDIGVSIPESLRMAGFDDVRYSRLISVPLTTIRQPVQEIARRAVSEMLGLKSRAADAVAPITLLDGSLIVRKSSIVEPGDRTATRRE
jgi:GntR family transcriptional regulator, arabinose operon transcriptional repressor